MLLNLEDDRDYSDKELSEIVKSLERCLDPRFLYCGKKSPSAVTIDQIRAVQEYFSQLGEDKVVIFENVEDATDGAKNSLLKMLEEPELKAALKTLGIESEVEGLRTANEKFDASLSAKAAEATDRQAQTSVKTADVVNAVNGTYQSIVQVVNAYAIALPTETINAFIDELNGVVTVYAATINRRGTGGSAAAGDGTIPDPEPEPEPEPENPDVV